MAGVGSPVAKFRAGAERKKEDDRKKVAPINKRTGPAKISDAEKKGSDGADKGHLEADEDDHQHVP